MKLPCVLALRTNEQSVSATRHFVRLFVSRRGVGRPPGLAAPLLAVPDRTPEALRAIALGKLTVEGNLIEPRPLIEVAGLTAVEYVGPSGITTSRFTAGALFRARKPRARSLPGGQHGERPGQSQGSSSPTATVTPGAASGAMRSRRPSLSVVR